MISNEARPATKKKKVDGEVEDGKESQPPSESSSNVISTKKSSLGKRKAETV